VGAKLKGEKISSTKREQSATPKQLEVLAHLLGVHISSENLSCSISIAKFE